MILLLPPETDLCLVLVRNTKYVVCLSFPALHEKCPNMEFFWSEWRKIRIRKKSVFGHIVQALKLNPTEYLRFINCYEKANRERNVFAQWHLNGHRLFVSKPKGIVFYRHTAIFKIQIYLFITKPLVCWGADVSIDICQLLLLFSIISPC